MNGLTLSLLAFTLVFATGFYWFRLAYAVALPSNRGAFVAAMAAGVALGIAGLAQGTGLAGGALAVLAILMGAFFIFTVTISAQKGGGDVLRPGAPLPAFTAMDHQGNTFDSSTLDGRPILLKFFRGHW